MTLFVRSFWRLAIAQISAAAFCLAPFSLVFAQVPGAVAEAVPLEKGRVVHAFVALCDNATQGIVPVPPRIGNGDDPDRNLYWGCDDGLRQVFKRSKTWRLVELTRQAPPAPVLERAVFKHRSQEVWLVAHAWRGAEMKGMMDAFLQAVSGASPPGSDVTVKDGDVTRHLAGPGGAAFLAFIGHNGLMDARHAFPLSQRAEGASVPLAVFCCKSHSYFTEGLRQSGGQPLLMTTQFMYPGAFLLQATLDGWLAGEKAEALRERAAAAYARNQKISVKAARGVFTVP